MKDKHEVLDLINGSKISIIEQMIDRFEGQFNLESESDLNKLFYGAMTVAGVYLVLDDFDDFKSDIKQFLKEIGII